MKTFTHEIVSLTKKKNNPGSTSHVQSFLKLHRRLLRIQDILIIAKQNDLKHDLGSLGDDQMNLSLVNLKTGVSVPTSQLVQTRFHKEHDGLGINFKFKDFSQCVYGLVRFSHGIMGNPLCRAAFKQTLHTFCSLLTSICV